ncbi:hypothetical protein H4683_003114 [Filibacter limicola]|uniref:Uncharacterized protein n=1 Tax=Sporosarcina limicola TaxID=34101 RepID=A0A927R5F9_9BACL|nr:DUF2600 family protein [Sporosarcina limicola]MBE1555993.1 hypothetical protein [Sporosarcina limicola]
MKHLFGGLQSEWGAVKMTLSLHPFSLMHQVYRKIIHVVHEELKFWRNRAEEIPNQELKEQALASIEYKTFHCEGGSIMVLTAMK